MKKKLFSDIEEEEIIKEYKSGLPMTTVGKNHKTSGVTIMRVLNRNGIETRTHGGIYHLPEEDIIREYQSGKSTNTISVEYGVCSKTICNILQKNNIDRDNLYHNIDLIEDYWETIDTYDKAYFLGFLITDGNISGNSVRLQISDKDSEILKVFSQKTNNTNKISYDNRNLASFQAKRSKWVSDLSKYGIVPRKTSTVYLPNLDENLMSHLIRGLIDGDGWITSRGHAIGFCGNETIVTQLKNYLVNKLGVYPVKVIHSEENLWSVTWSGISDIKTIGNFIYKDKGNCYLFRKYENFINIIANTEVSSEITKGSETP